MKITRRGFDLTIERTEGFFSLQTVVTFRWCPACCQDVGTLPPEAAARAVGITARELYRLIETGQIHFSETSAGELFICMESVSPKEMR